MKVISCDFSMQSERHDPNSEVENLFLVYYRLRWGNELTAKKRKYWTQFPVPDLAGVWAGPSGQSAWNRNRQTLLWAGRWTGLQVSRGCSQYHILPARRRTRGRRASWCTFPPLSTPASSHLAWRNSRWEGEGQHWLILAKNGKVLCYQQFFLYIYKITYM